jgi:translation initiation factor IF-2
MADKKLAQTSIEDKLLACWQAGQKRPPIVAVLGHVDHGKTSLISKIYEKDLTKKEFGGISQHIGAYCAKFVIRNSQFAITFIDTPGHVAFSKMRSRGAKVADLAVLVVAADEGVKPQTLESLKHIQEANIPFLVAANKIDLPNVNLDWLKGNLAENGILVEGWGGNVVFVPVSAKTGKGVDELLEMILLLWEMEEVKSDPEGELEAVVIESRLDSKKGPVATILIRNGSLKVGEEIRTEEVGGKIRAMIDDRGRNVNVAYPGEAVEILGFSKVPLVGSKIIRGSLDEKLTSSKPKTLEKEEEEEKKIKIILKTDTQGTLEAILGSLPQEVKVVFSGVGNINESDILLAKTSGAQIVGFNVKASGTVEKLAETEEVEIKTYNIIYELLEDLEKKVLKLLEPTIDEEILGQAKIIAEFIVKNQRVAGCRVEEGEIERKFPLHLKRGGKVIGDCQIISMKVGKEDVEKVKKGGEFGVILSSPVDFKVGDMLISFRKLP